MEIVVAVVVERLLEVVLKSVTEDMGRFLNFQREIDDLSLEMKQLQGLLRSGGAQSREKLSAVQDLVYDVEDVIIKILFDVVDFQLIYQKESNTRGWFATPEKYLTGFKLTGFKFMLNIRTWMLIPRIRLVNDELLASQRSRSFLPPGQLGSEDLPPSFSADDGDFVDLDAFWKYEGDSIVGIEDVKKVISRLLPSKEEGKELKVVSIVGMGGIGKTTLAKSVFRDDSVRRHFDCAAWAFVGHHFQTRLVYEDILLSLSSHTREEMMSFSDLDLAELIYNFLQTRKYLIVLDDVWETDAWDCLNIAFPSYENSGSRVLLTTRLDRVARIAASTNGFVHQMSGLNQEQSLELLLRTAFRTQSLDYKDVPELMECAKYVVRNCSGIPLAVKVMGGLLAAQKPTPNEWKKVHQTMVSYQAKFVDTVENVLNLAYDSLPYYLKPCFLYLAFFPEGGEVMTQELYHLWLAEGFLVTSKDTSAKVSMLDVAEWYLYQLCTRSMVLVHKPEVSTSRRFSSCRVHDLIYKLCLSKAVEGDFCVDMHIGRANDIKVKSSSTSSFSSHKIRRLALSFDVGCLDLPKRDVNKHSLRSLFGDHQQSSLKLADLFDLSRLRVFRLSNYKMLRLPMVKRKLIPQHFLTSVDFGLTDLKSLVVLHCSGLNFNTTSLSTEIGKLHLLRCLRLRDCYIESLPSAICSLKYLEILDVRECIGTKMFIPVELQMIRSLRYLYLPYNFEVMGAGKLRLNELINLEILVNFDSTHCEVKDICKLTQVKKLVATMSGDLEELAEMNLCIKASLDSLLFSSLRVRMYGYYSVEKSFAIQDLLEFPNLHVLRMEGLIGKLPSKISHSLSKLSLSDSELDEDPMEKLEKLPNFLFLALRNNAFVGKYMTCSVSGMPLLRHLTLLNLNNLESLLVQKGGMPNLCTLALESCPNLKDPPVGLSFLTSLQEVKFSHMPSEFVDRLNLARESLSKHRIGVCCEAAEVKLQVSSLWPSL